LLQNWSKLLQKGQNWYNIVKIDEKWVKVDEKRSKIDETWSKLMKMVKIDDKLVKIDEKLVKINEKLVKHDQNWWKLVEIDEKRVKFFSSETCVESSLRAWSSLNLAIGINLKNDWKLAILRICVQIIMAWFFKQLPTWPLFSQ
jgi:hypothetical protein